MSSSQNSETTLSKQHSTKNFSKFGMDFRYGLITEQVPAWENKVVETEGRSALEWFPVEGAMHESTYVAFALIKDEGHCEHGKPIYVYSTADGPILAIELSSNDTEYELLDPCIVQFDPRNLRLNMVPIFNVARILRLCKSSVRAIQAPAELLLASYPGFIISNRMSKYQLKAATPFTTTDVEPAHKD